MKEGREKNRTPSGLFIPFVFSPISLSPFFPKCASCARRHLEALLTAAQERARTVTVPELNFGGAERFPELTCRPPRLRPEKIRPVGLRWRTPRPSEPAGRPAASAATPAGRAPPAAAGPAESQ